MSRRSKNKSAANTSSKVSSKAPNQSGNPFQPRIKRRNHWIIFIICLFLALAVWAVFGQTIHYEFVNYDDDLYIYGNPTITGGLNLHTIIWKFMHTTGFGEGYPLTEISHMLDWQLYGDNAGGHHLTNVLLHTATVVLLFLVLQKLTGAIWRSAFVAAVFAIHPLRVESVAWATERKDVLSGFFFMLTLWTWTRYTRRLKSKRSESNMSRPISAFDPRRWTVDYYLALVFFTLGLFSKTILVTLPCILLLLDYWPLNRLSYSVASTPRHWFNTWLGLSIEKFPFWLLSVIACVATVRTQRSVVVAAQDSTFLWQIGNALLAYVDYLWHMVYPIGLALLYPPPGKDLPVLQVGMAALMLFIISSCIIVGRKKYPYLLMGWLWYLVMLLPVIDVMQAGDQARADRYTYLPQIGLYVLVTWGVVEICSSWRYRRPVLGITAGMILIILLAGAYVQTTYWRNSVSLWTHTLTYRPQSHIVHCDLGIALAAEGKLDEAVQHFQQALQFKPDDAKSLDNLGKVLSAQGKLDEAAQCFHKALQFNPIDTKALNNLGVTLAAQAKPDEAVRSFRQAIQLETNYIDAYFNLGNTLVAQGKLDEAAQSYDRALQLDPYFAEAYCNLGLLLVRQGKLDEAIKRFQQALQLKPDYPVARDNLGDALAAQTKIDQAAQYYNQTLQQNPDDPDAINNLGVALARQGKLDEALSYFRRAQQVNPNDASTYNNLGITLAKQGKLDEAIRNFQQSLKLAEVHNDAALAESVRIKLKLYQAASVKTHYVSPMGGQTNDTKNLPQN